MYLLHWAQEAFIPIVLSILISYCARADRHDDHASRVPRIIAAGLVVMMAGGALGYGVYSLSDDAAAIVAQLPEAAQRLRDRCNATHARADRTGQKAAAELQKTAIRRRARTRRRKDVTRVQIEEPAINVRQYVTWGSASLFDVLRAGDARLLLRVLPAGVGRPVQAQARETGRALTGEKEDHRSDPRRDQPPDRPLPFVRIVTSVVVGVATWIAFSMIGLEAGGALGTGAASSTRALFRTGDRGDRPLLSWVICSLEPWKWPSTSRAYRS
jgi:hypothetical protein